MSMKKTIVSKPLPRPSSGGKEIDLKKPSVMEVLAPDRTSAEESMLSKSGSHIKKEIRLERTVSGGTSNFEDYMKAKIKEYDGLKTIPLPSDQSKPSQSEEFKKVASKPFEKKAKKTIEKDTLSAEVSSAKTRLQSTAINSSDTSSEYGSDNSKIKFMGTVIPTTVNVLDENKVNFSNSYWKVSEKESANNATNANKKETKKQPIKKEVYESDEDEEIMSENVNYDDSRKKIDAIMNKKQAQEKLLMEYLNHVKNLKDEKGQNLVVIPSNFDAIVEVAVDQRKAQDDLLEKGLIEEGDDLMDESNIDKLIDNMIENQEGQKKGKIDPYAQEKKKIKELDKVLAEKENKYRDRKNRDKIKKVNESHDDISEMSTEDIKSKLFITEYKKKNVRQSMEELQAQKVKLELAQAILKNEAKFGKTNTIDVPEVVTESYRLQAMMAEIEKEIEDGEERSIVDSKLFSNPYQNDEFQARIKEIDEKLVVEFGYQRPTTKDDEFSELPKDKFLREIAEERLIREKSDALTKKLMVIAQKEQNGELENPEVISKLIEEIKKESYLPELTPIIPFDSLEEVAKQSNQILLSYNTDELLRDLKDINEDYDKVGKEIKKLRGEMNKKITTKEAELQEKEKKRKMMEYLKEINSKQDQIGKIFVESVNAETDLLNNLERKLNELRNKDEESEHKLQNFTHQPETAVISDTKSIQDYDKEISDKVAKLALSVPALDEEKDRDELEVDNDEPLVDIEELKRKYGIKDEDIEDY